MLNKLRAKRNAARQELENAIISGTGITEANAVLECAIDDYQDAVEDMLGERLVARYRGECNE